MWTLYAQNSSSFWFTHYKKNQSYSYKNFLISVPFDKLNNVLKNTVLFTSFLSENCATNLLSLTSVTEGPDSVQNSFLFVQIRIRPKKDPKLNGSGSEALENTVGNQKRIEANVIFTSLYCTNLLSLRGYIFVETKHKKNPRAGGRMLWRVRESWNMKCEK